MTEKKQYDLTTKEGLCELGFDATKWMREHPDQWISRSPYAKRNDKDCFCFIGVCAMLVGEPLPTTYDLHDDATLRSNSEFNRKAQHINTLMLQNNIAKKLAHTHEVYYPIWELNDEASTADEASAKIEEVLHRECPAHGL